MRVQSNNNTRLSNSIESRGLEHSSAWVGLGQFGLWTEVPACAQSAPHATWCKPGKPTSPPQQSDLTGSNSSILLLVQWTAYLQGIMISRIWVCQTRCITVWTTIFVGKKNQNSRTGVVTQPACGASAGGRVQCHMLPSRSSVVILTHMQQHA